MKVQVLRVLFVNELNEEITYKLLPSEIFFEIEKSDESEVSDRCSLPPSLPPSVCVCLPLSLCESVSVSLSLSLCLGQLPLFSASRCVRGGVQRAGRTPS